MITKAKEDIKRLEQTYHNVNQKISNGAATAAATTKEEFENLYETLQTERDEIKLQLNLASMEVKEEFEAAEKHWESIKSKAGKIMDDTQNASEELIAKTKEEIKQLEQNYHNVNQKISNSAATAKEEFKNLYETLQTERDEIKLQLNLASMEIKEEFEPAEKQWQTLKVQAANIADATKETSEELVSKAKIVAEELKKTHEQIKKRLSK
jgi:short-subunit dehydrogenase involved in D-alanine esterification of teichoic acids